MEVVTECHLVTDGAKSHGTQITPQSRDLLLQREEVRRSVGGERGSEKGKRECVRGRGGK